MNLGRRAKVYKTVQSPLELLDDVDFFKRYRMDKETVEFIVATIREDLVFEGCRGRSTSPEMQVLMAIDYIRSPGFQASVGSDLGFSQQTDIRANSQFFFEANGFPSVVGIVDGTHVRIQAPPLRIERDFVNRKNFHSVNVQVIVDYRGMFTNVVAKWPGSSHDSFIMRNSNVWEGYESGQLRGIILGDSGYALRPWLMTPFAAPSTAAQKRYNSSLCKTRVLVEQVIGRWKRRFHSLHGELWIALERVPQFIIAAAVLHNICRLRGVSDENDEDMLDEQPPEEVNADDRISTGSNMRNSIVNRYFTR